MPDTPLPATGQPYLTQAQIAAASPVAAPPSDPMSFARERMRSTGQWHALQTLGRNHTMGCVALEITQRCNLDCTLCYLSESAEAVHDLPLAEVFRRIDLIHAHYGDDTNVQVTGGDPTLRNRLELIAIVRRIAERGMRPSLFTNGIRATRDLLAELTEAGLVDVAFHVDTTQNRRGFTDEASLNPLRLDYIARTRGLGLSVMFNTTVHPGNFHEVPILARFFADRAAGVRLASFQLAAETGRGAGPAGQPIAPDTVAAALQTGTGTPINFRGLSVGHHACNRYTMMLAAGGQVADLMRDTILYADIMQAMEGRTLDRRRPWHCVATVVLACCSRGRLALRLIAAFAGVLWQLRHGLIASRFRIHKISFFIHGFMGARCLEPDRIDSCSFSVMTAQGPISMCLHNAKRDDFVLRPSKGLDGRWWNPLTGGFSDAEPARSPPALTRAMHKGRTKAWVS